MAGPMMYGQRQMPTDPDYPALILFILNLFYNIFIELWLGLKTKIKIINKYNK